MFEESDLKNVNAYSQSSLAFDLTAVRNLTSFKAGGRSFILRPSTQQCKLFEQVQVHCCTMYTKLTLRTSRMLTSRMLRCSTLPNTSRPKATRPSVRPSVSRPAPRVEDGSGQCEGSKEVVAGKLKQLFGEKMSCGIPLE